METGTRGRRFRMRVDGMTCPSCEHHVEKALSEAGAHDVEADFRRGEALLSVDGPLQDAMLATAVQDAGYKPGPIEPLETIALHESDLVEYRLPVEGMTCADCERHVADTFFPPQSSSAWSSMVSPPRRSVAKCRLVLEVLGVGSRMPSTGHGTSRPGDVRSRDRPADGRGRRGDDEGILRNQVGSDQTPRAWQAAGGATRSRRHPVPLQPEAIVQHGHVSVRCGSDGLQVGATHRYRAQPLCRRCKKSTSKKDSIVLEELALIAEQEQ